MLARTAADRPLAHKKLIENLSISDASVLKQIMVVEIALANIRSAVRKNPIRHIVRLGA